MKPKVFITRKIPQAGINLLKKHCLVKVYPKDKVIPRKELLKEVKKCDLLLTNLTNKVDKKLINANPKLKIIANYAVGFNNIDLDYAKKKGIPVSNTPGKLISDAVAEHAIALMFAISKRVIEADQFTRKGKYKGWSPTLFLGTQLAGKTLGVVGLGRIGTSVVERASHGLGMNILYYDVARNPKFEKKYKAKKVSLANLLKKSDFVTLHVPLLPSTKHLIGSKELKLMKKTAFLINTSRGPVINERALVSALRTKKIAGAGIDVYEKEPKLAPGLNKLNNVVLTPHIASSTIEARSEMAVLAAKNIIAAVKGKKILNKVI